MWNLNIFHKENLKFHILYAKIGKDFDLYKKAMNVSVVNYTFFRERESSAGNSLKVR